MYKKFEFTEPALKFSNEIEKIKLRGFVHGLRPLVIDESVDGAASPLSFSRLRRISQKHLIENANFNSTD